MDKTLPIASITLNLHTGNKQ